LPGALHAHRAKKGVEAIMHRLIAWLCLLPALYVVGFFAYVSLANDPGCGSQHPGLCFGAGLGMMFMAPLAVITGIVAAVLFFRSRKDKTHPTNAP